MSTRSQTTKPSLHSQGFTLVEVLFAIVILLIGVVAAMRIFPRGFDIFTSTQQSYTGMAQVDGLIGELAQHPENLPDGIYPVSYGDFVVAGDQKLADLLLDPEFCNDFSATTVTTNSLTAFDKYLFDQGSGSKVWPLWEPLYTRMFRRVVGERCVIPSSFDSSETLCKVTNVQTTGTEKVLTVDVPNTALLADGMRIRIVNPDGMTFVVEIAAWDSAAKTFTVDASADVQVGATISSILAFAPKYIVRFGPIADINSISIYDLRYRRVSENELKAIAGNGYTDGLYYAADYTNGILKFPKSVKGHRLRCSLYCAKDISSTALLAQLTPINVDLVEGDIPIGVLRSDDSLLGTATSVDNYPDPFGVVHMSTADLSHFSVNQVVYIDNPTAQDLVVKIGSVSTDSVTVELYPFPKPITLEAGAKLYSTVLATGKIDDDDQEYLLQFNLPSDWKLIPGSEQLNRAYKQALSRENIPSGYFYPENGTGLLLGTLFFAPQDAGRTVKIDYTVADWNILHETISVDKDEASSKSRFRLALSPKVRNRPGGPHESQSWGLYGPMEVGSVVLGMVDTQTGIAYEVSVNDPQSKDPVYHIEAKSGAGLTDIAVAIDQQKTRRAEFNLAALKPPFIWRGEWYSAYNNGNGYSKNDVVYRYLHTYQCMTANTTADPATNTTAWEPLSDDNLDWDALAGKTFRVFYRAVGDWTLQFFRAPSIFWYTSAPAAATVDSLRTLTLGWNCFTWVADSSNHGWLAVPGIYSGQSIAIDYLYHEDPANASSPLNRANGETHTIAELSGSDRNVLVKLRHVPAANTLVTVRGQSVSVRALWMQQRRGTLRQLSLSGGNFTHTNMNVSERWQSKESKIVLPENVE